MTEKTIRNEKAIIDEILRRKGSQHKRIPAEKMKVFKTRLAAEIERTGGLRPEFVEHLLRQLKNANGK